MHTEEIINHSKLRLEKLKLWLLSPGAKSNSLNASIKPLKCRGYKSQNNSHHETLINMTSNQSYNYTQHKTHFLSIEFQWLHAFLRKLTVSNLSYIKTSMCILAVKQHAPIPTMSDFPAQAVSFNTHIQLHRKIYPDKHLAVCTTAFLTSSAPQVFSCISLQVCLPVTFGGDSSQSPR